MKSEQGYTDKPQSSSGLVPIAEVLEEVIADLELDAEQAARRRGRLRGRVGRRQRAASRDLDRLEGARQQLEEECS